MYPAFLLHKRYWIFNNSGLFSWVCAACSDGMCMGWLLFFSFIKLNINTKLAFDSSAECFVAQVSRWWGSSSRWLKPKGGCCRQPQVSVLLLRVMWMGWCWAGLSRREAAVVEEVSLCIFAHPLDAHLCTYAHSQSVWKFLLGSVQHCQHIPALTHRLGSCLLAEAAPLQFYSSHIWN